MMHLMGESNRQGLRLDFDRRRKLEFHGSKVSSDVGLLAYQDIDDVPDPAEGRTDFPRQPYRQDRMPWHDGAVQSVGPWTPWQL